MIQGNVKEFSSGLLELSSQGTALVGISIRLTSGQLLLRSGAALQDSPEVAVHIRGVHFRFLRLQLHAAKGFTR